MIKTKNLYFDTAATTPLDLRVANHMHEINKDAPYHAMLIGVVVAAYNALQSGPFSKFEVPWFRM